MIEVSVLDGVIQSFFTFLGIIFVYNYLLNNRSIRNMVEYTIILIMLSLIGGILNDFVFLLLILFVTCKEKKSKEGFNFSHLNLLLALISGQILIAMLATYLSRWLIYAFFNVHSLNSLTQFGHTIIAVQILLMYVFGFITLKIIYRVMRKNSLSITRLHEFKVDKHFFVVLLGLFASIEILMLVSDFQGVTASIQLTLLITFILMVSLMGWQMIETISVYVQQKTLENEQQQREQFQDYLKDVEQQYIELRKFKHDYQNLIVSFSSQTDMSKVKEYLVNATNNEVFDTSLNDVKIAQVQHLKNDIIRGLIVKKFFSAKQNNVELNVEISSEINYNNDNTMIIVRIIGNLLDNAIDQAKKMTDKTVTVAFNNINDTTEISINNAVDSGFDQRKIFETGYSTKGNNRGLGLTNVRELVDQQQGFYLDVDSKDSYVTMTLIIMEDN